ncbi:hypothetical protein ACFWBB_31120 [Streptomyces sp. NPDC060000]|uniref:hypothetical protein n=1 Tax=Streptomyces sp. NPDC060000 TaxID=3347031 RepID=UPI0036CD5998
METSEQDTNTDSHEDAEAAEHARRLVIGTSVARAERCLLTIEEEAAAKHPDRPDLQESYALGGLKTALEHLVQEVKPFGASDEEVERFWAPLRAKTPPVG